MKAVIWFAVLLLVAAGAGCAFRGDAVLHAAPVPAASTLARAHNAFGFTLLKSLYRDANKKNIFLSPTSIELALSMVYIGARGETKAAMAKTLHLEGLDVGQINRESLQLIERGSAADLGAELAIADSLWARQGAEIRTEFVETATTYYKAKVTTLDFDKPSAVGIVNAWVSENTRGKIPTIVEPPIPSDMVLYLINAVYFKGRWTSEFDKKLTQERTFTPGSGPPRKHPLMSQGGEFPYLETEDFQSVKLAYGKNRQLSMCVFLPKKNLNDLLAKLDQPTWDAWMGKYESTEGTILLPRFKMEYEKELRDVLIRLGMGPAFADRADLRGIGKQLSISEVKHKSYVDVNEEGTEAAAVTSVGIVATAMPGPSRTFYLEVNRPFLFAIRDEQSGEILFLGAVQNP